MNLFQNRKLVIATMHHKEQVIQPILASNLGCICIVSKKLNTDNLGTFSGEIERLDDPVSAARKKCLLAMELTNTDIAVASEGSFGPHPSYFFINADDEFLLFIDRKNQLEIIVRELSVDTNLNGTYINNEVELKEFAEKVNFPSHGLIVRKSENELINLYKGITDWNELKEKFNILKNKFDRAYIETDMRAMFNPTRMEVIRKLTEKLVEKINSKCPKCETHGFGVTDVKLGLPCLNCSFPTKSVRAHVLSCVKCNYSIEKHFPNKKEKEDPMYCDFCNP